jgi:hypothetical protein
MKTTPKHQRSFKEGALVEVDLHKCSTEFKPKWEGRKILGTVRSRAGELKDWWMVRLQNGQNLMFHSSELHKKRKRKIKADEHGQNANAAD